MIENLFKTLFINAGLIIIIIILKKRSMISL